MLSTFAPVRDLLAEANRKLTEAKTRQTAAQQEVRDAISVVKNISDTLKNGGKFELSVSEHAMLRYAERVLGFDTSEVLRAVENKVAPAAYLLGDCSVPIAPGFLAVVKNRVVVSVVPA